MKAKELRYPFTWENRKPIIQDSVCFIPSNYSLHYQWKKKPFFSNNNPIYLEFCSGNGEWIINKALQHPNINWIAVEIKFDRVQKIWAKMKNLDLSNLVIICGDANLAALYYIPQSSVDRFYINFPDPWPKQKHAKNRLMQEEFLVQIGSLAKSTASLYFVTDHESYLQQTYEIMKLNKYWGIDTVSEFNSNEYGESYFGRLWQNMGKKIQLLKAEIKRENKQEFITLDISTSSLLDWSKEISEIESLISQGKKISIYLDLSINLEYASLLNEVFFQTHSFAMEQFNEQIYNPYREYINEICLFKGPLDFTSSFYHSDVAYDGFIQWAKDTYTSVGVFSEITGIQKQSFYSYTFNDLTKSAFGKQQLRLYAVGILSEYLHRLAALLPEESTLKAHFDKELVTKNLFIYQLLGEETFPFIHAVENNEEADIGLILPFAKKTSMLAIKSLEKTLQELNSGKVRIIPESKIADNWHELDYLVVNSNALTPAGLRQLQGFNAAGGAVVNIGTEKLGLMDEFTWEEFQSQSREFILH